MTDLIERLRILPLDANDSDSWALIEEAADEIERQAAEIERLKELLCAHEAAAQMMGDYGKYLKDGETVEHCIERNRKDAIAVTGLLAKSKAEVERQAALLKQCKEALNKLYEMGELDRVNAALAAIEAYEKGTE